MSVNTDSTDSGSKDTQSGFLIDDVAEEISEVLKKIGLLGLGAIITSGSLYTLSQGLILLTAFTIVLVCGMVGLNAASRNSKP